MGMDVEVGNIRDSEGGEESDDQTDDRDDFESASTQPSTDRGGHSPCLCQHFVHQSYLRRLQLEAHVECRWMTFSKELVYHVSFPLSLPLLYWFEGGMNGIINRQYWGSRVALRQWILAGAFYAMNIISRFFLVPDIVIANMLIVMTHVVLATKYGFYTKADMKEMREKILSHEALDDRTLFLAWTNPIPLRILKRQLLLAAARNSMLKCSETLRVVPGASRNTVKEIMHQLSHEKRSAFARTGRGRRICKSRKSSKVNVIDCAYCVKNSCTDRDMEDRWVQLIMSRLRHDRGCQLPESSEMSSEEDSRVESNVRATGEVENEDAPFKKDRTTNDQVDLPAILLAAHLLQQSGYLLSKKKFGHQLLKNPLRVWIASGIIGFIHTAIPYIVRGITGTPVVWGGNAWYVHVANLCSIFINSQCMAASVSFMIAGVADFRRRYFAARLLNTLLKDGCIGTETVCSERVSAETDACLREVMKREERRKSEYHTGVAVDYGRATSIVGWWAMRVLVLDFGLVFSRRVKYYASYFCIYCGVLMAFLLIVLFAKGTANAAYTMGVVAFDLLVFIGLLSLIVFPGGETNKMHLGHGATLVFKKMELSNKLRGYLDGAPSKEREPYLFAFKVMGTVSEALAWDNSITKVTILGFKAGSEVISVLLGFGGAAIGIVAQQFTSYLGGN